MPERSLVLEMRHVTKRFPGIVANDDISFDLREGEVHALLGENGAGKSTLMNILYGLYHPDEGEILIKGKPVRLGSPSAAIDAGVGMVHQHFMLIPVMTVAENIVLAQEPTTGGVFLDIAEAERRVKEISDRYGLAVDPRARIDRITVGQQQRVEILKALYREADILVLDEPTAVLTPQEAKELFEVVRSLTERGKLIETLPAEGATEAGLARLMVGREVLLRVAKTPAHPAEPLLEIEELRVVDDRGIEKVRALSLEVRAGEIVGIAGIDGNGQTELIDAISGLYPIESGTVSVGGEDVTSESAHGHLEAGLGHIPEDRQRRGLVLEYSIAENLALHDYRSAPASRFGWLFPRRLVQRARALIREFDVRGGGPTTRAGGLSGGTQQKVVLAREIDRDPKVLIAAQPTRGLDVGAIEFVHRRLIEERDEGRAILLVSLELEEVLSLSDRILVIYEGEIVGEFPPTASEEELGIAMTGAGRSGVAA
jgi:ABC-type uncharacterized transport system ATPase subunit